MVAMLRLIAAIISILASAAPAAAARSDCLAMAYGPAGVQRAGFMPAALQPDEVQLTYVGHSTFLIESPGGVKIATDYAGYSGGVLPDVVSLAHELSGLGSTRAVQFSVSARRRIDEPDDMATGSQDEKIQGRIEPMGEEGTVGNGGRRAAGDIGAAVPPVPGSL